MGDMVNSRYEKMLAEAKIYDLFIRYRAHPELLWQAMTVNERMEWGCSEEEYCRSYKRRATLLGLAGLVGGILFAGLVIAGIILIYR